MSLDKQPSKRAMEQLDNFWKEMIQDVFKELLLIIINLLQNAVQKKK